MLTKDTKGRDEPWIHRRTDNIVKFVVLEMVVSPSGSRFYLLKRAYTMTPTVERERGGQAHQT